MKMTISARVSKSFSLKHDTRKIIADNVDTAKTKDNISWVSPGEISENGTRYANIKEVYDKIFESYWRDFQDRQMPTRRTEKSYYQTICDKKYNCADDNKRNIPSEAYEFIFQVGNCDTAKVDTENGDKCKELLTDFYKDFISRDYICTITEKELNDPNWKPPFDNGLIIIGAYNHADEKGKDNSGTNHLHILTVPYSKMERGSLYQCNLKKTFDSIGYPTEFSKEMDKPITDKNNNIKKDKNGNILYHEIATKKGVIDWLEDQKKIIQNDMKLKYDWDREKQTDGRNTYLQINDYRVFKAKERAETLENNINNAETDAIEKIITIIESQETITKKLAETLSEKAFSSISADDTFMVMNYINTLSQGERDKLLTDIRMSKITDKSFEHSKKSIEKLIIDASVKNLTDTLKDKNINILWEEYREKSEHFWNWYNTEKSINKGDLKYISDKTKDNAIRIKYVNDFIFRSNLLIFKLLGLLLQLFLKCRQEVLLDEMKEIIRYKKELAETAKEYSSISYNERAEINLVKTQKALLKSLRNAENSIKKEYSNIEKVKEK